MKKITKKILSIALFVLCAVCGALSLVACKDKNGAGSGVKVTLVGETYAETTFTLKKGDALPVITETDKDFEGYWTDAAYTEKYDGETVPAKDVTLYYKQNYQYYTVNLDFGELGVKTLFKARRGVNEVIPDSALADFSVAGFAETAGGDIKYAVGTESNKVYNLAEKDGTATLYAVYEIKNVEDFTIENGTVTAYNGAATEITLPYGATKIAAEAFKDNKTLTSVTVPATYTSIGKGAFAGCEKLETVTVPFVGGTRTSNRFFAYIFGASGYAENEFSFAAYVMNNNNLYMGDMHFENLFVPRTLKTVIINDTVKEFAEGAFYKAYSLENVILENPAALNKIGDYAFAYCPALGKQSDIKVSVCFDWLSSVTEIGKYAFAAYTGNYENAAKEMYPYGEEYKDTYVAKLYESPYPFTNLTDIPELTNVQTIKDSAFNFCYAIKDVKFGNKLKTLGMNAFYYCATHTSLSLPDSVTEIGEYAFFSNASVLTLDIGANVRSIGTRAFAYCSSLSQIKFAGEDAPIVGNQAFCNSLKSSTNPTTGSTEYEMVIDDMRMYVPDGAAKSYASSLAAYKDYIEVAQSDIAPAYWYDKNGELTTKFEFTSGGIVNVTDKNQAFILSVDYWNFGKPTYGANCGESYPMMYEFIDEKTYDLTAGLHNKPLYANQKVVHIWHPELLNWDGSTLNNLYFIVTELPYNIDGTKYLLPVMVKTVGVEQGGTKYGDVKVTGSYVAYVNKYGAVKIGKASKESGSEVENWFDDPADTYYMSFEKSADHEYKATYYNDKYEIIKTMLFRSKMKGATDSVEDPLYLVYDSSTEPDATASDVLFAVNSAFNDNNELYLDGLGSARIKIGNDSYSVGTVTNGKDLKFGEEGFTLSLSAISKNGTLDASLTGTVTFGKVAKSGEYLTLTATIGDVSYEFVNVTYDAGWYRTGYGEYKGQTINYPVKSDDLANDEWRYKILTDVQLGATINLYVYAPDGNRDNPEFAYFREYTEDDNLYCGEVKFRKNGVMKFAYGDGDEREARLVDKRGSFELDDKGGTTYRKFVHYVDSEDMTLVLTENFYGTTLYYYTVKTDGFGNMYVLDQHDDGFDDAYMGTYDDYGSFTANGTTYYELIFKGRKLDADNKPVGEEKTFWILYAFSSLSAYSDDYADAQWYGTLASIYENRDDKKFTAYDNFGYKLYDITVDVYGNTSYKAYSYTLTMDGKVTYTEVKNESIDRLVAVMDGSGEVSYFFAVGNDGTASYSLRLTGDNSLKVSKEGAGLKFTTETASAVLEIELDKLKKL